MKFRKNHLLLLAAGLDGRLGGLASLVNLDNSLDDTNGNSLSHVTDGKTTKRRVLGKGLDAHGLLGDHLDNGGITRLDKLGISFELLTRTAINLLLQSLKLAGNVSSMAIENGGVSGLDLTRVVQDNNLSGKALGTLGGIVLGVTADVSTLDVLDRDVLDVETNVVSGVSLRERLVVHLDRLDFCRDHGGSKGDNHAGLDDTSLDTANGHCSNTTNLVDILEGKAEGLVGGTARGENVVKSLKESAALLVNVLLLNLDGLGPSLVPRHVGGGLEHVVAVETRDGDKGDLDGVVTNLLDVAADFLGDFLETGLAVWGLGVIHLVDSNNELLDTKGESEQSVLAGLAVLGNTSLKLTNTSSDDKDGAIGLRGTGNHVLDEITVTRGIDNGDVVLVGLELPQGDINGDTTFTLGFELVKNPGVLERTLTHFLGFLLELLDGTLVDTTALVDQVTGCGGFTGIDVANDDNVDMSLFLTHGEVWCARTVV
mmetsp:Transcript_4318/g.4079  ORF Transcript_4318/g.4079 Transcript_4318/m.4079 type:complete len:485 (+) Transcript_4318:154-1608(+)